MSNLFSIITASYNNKDTLFETIQNVFNQDFENYEHIIIDNCSEDGTKEMVEQFINNNPNNKIKFFQEKDSGIYDAFNKGINKSKGKYISFLGCGDKYSENILNDISKIIESNLGISVFYGIVNITDGKNSYYYSRSASYLAKGDMMHHSTCFVKKEDYIEIGCFDTNYCSAGDLDAFIKLYQNNKQFFFIPKIISIFQVGGVSTSSSLPTIEKNEILNKYKIISEKKYKIFKFKKILKKILGK